MKKLINSFTYAIQGVQYALSTQRNLRIHFVIASLVILLGWFLKLTTVEWAVLILTIDMVITGEMINTAIEKTIDLVTEEYRVLAKIAKDLTAGAVLVSAVFSVIIGLLIFLPKLVG